MASETLPVPEEHLEEVIKVIREGLKHVKVKPAVSKALKQWCDEEEEYLERLKS